MGDHICAPAYDACRVLLCFGMRDDRTNSAGECAISPCVPTMTEPSPIMGRWTKPTIAALEELRASGASLLPVTGREIDDLRKVFPRLDLFERVVAENGALIYRPATREERVLQ